MTQPQPAIDYYASLPKVVASASALIRDERGRVLLVEPNYRPGDWLLPGGAMDQGERPWAAARREVKEEVGLDLPEICRLLAVDWSPATSERPAICVFVFDGGTVDAARAPHDIRLQTSELSTWRLCEVAEFGALLPEFRARRVHACIDAIAQGCPAYLEDGRP